MASAPGGASDPTVRVLVVGDSGVGKTSLVSLLVNKRANLASQWTVGCNLQVMATTYASSGGNVDYFVEFRDVGGSKKYSISRHVFYRGVHGVLLVYDMSNRKSYANLRKWIQELVAADEAVGGLEAEPGSGFSHGSSMYDRHASRLRSRSRSGRGSGAGGAGAGGGVGGRAGEEDHLAFDGASAADTGSRWFRRPTSAYAAAEKRLGELPILIVANKLDLAAPGVPPSDTMADYGIESVEVTSTQDKLHAPALDMFIRRVIRRTVKRAAGSGAGSGASGHGAGRDVATEPGHGHGSGAPGLMAVHGRFGVGGGAGAGSMEANVHTPTRLVAPEQGLTNTRAPGVEYGFNGGQPGDAAVVVMGPTLGATTRPRFH